jgi:WhiB family transcriptional regulator, redox-sensing transcriptional regulator
VLTTLAPEDVTPDTIGLGPLPDTQGLLDPLAKECPDDVPCRVQNPDLWFAETPADLEQAKALCQDCPARLACLAGAIERREPWGVWGGEIFERGAIVARKRPRGLPHKDDRTEVAA